MNISNATTLTPELISQSSSIKQAANPSKAESSTTPKTEELKFYKTVYKGGIDRSQLSTEESLKLTHQYSRRSDEAYRVLTNTTFDMREDYSKVQSEIIEKNPSLLSKDWDFTVNETGQLKIIEGEDSLSASEKIQLTNILEDHDMDKYMSKITDSVVERGIASRGPEKYMHEHGVGSFDITEENSSDILRGRELMNDTKLRFMVRGRPEDLRANEAYNEHKLSPLQSIMKQLTERADEIYRYDPSVEVKLK